MSLLALATAIAVTAGVVAVLGGQEKDRAEPQPVAMDVVATIDPTTSTTVQVLNAFIGLHPDEETFITTVLEEALPEPTTTTTTTTTAPPASNQAKSSAPPPTTTTTGPPPPSTTAPASTGEFRSDYEAEFFSRINSLRAAKGLPAIKRDGSLNNRARDWSRRMADGGKLIHSNLSSLIPPWSSAAENVARGGSVSSIFSALTGSGGHLSNMLGEFTHVGIGVWVDANGGLWTTHVFTR